MSMLSMALKPDEIAKQIKTFESKKKDYEKAHKQWLDGRDIRQAEKEAEDAVKRAELDAAQIRKEAVQYVESAKADAIEAEEAKAAAQGQEKTNKRLQAELKKSIAASDKKAAEYGELLSDLQDKMTAQSKAESALMTKLDRLQALVNELANDNAN